MSSNAATTCPPATGKVCSRPRKTYRAPLASDGAEHHETTVIVSSSVWMNAAVLFPPAPGIQPPSTRRGVLVSKSPLGTPPLSTTCATTAASPRTTAPTTSAGAQSSGRPAARLPQVSHTPPSGP